MTINGERLFLFVDETGDPGHPDKDGASTYYQLNIIATGKEGLEKLSQHLASFRYFNRADKELKRYQRQSDLLRDVFQNLSGTDLMVFYSFCINKETYIGPYLKNIHRNKDVYNPKKFRNFIVKKSLEYFFEQEQSARELTEIELVFDRYLEN